MKPTLTLLRKELLQRVRRHGEAGLADPLDLRRCGSPRARAGFTPNRVRYNRQRREGSCGPLSRARVVGRPCGALRRAHV